VHLSDVLHRRTSLAFTGSLTAGLVDEIARVVGGVLGWDDAERTAQITAALDRLRDAHQVDLRVDAAKEAPAFS
jgi:glycerol-3-phosphate dehydrogenase